MNTQNKVFEKLFSDEKVELASQKYEFGVIEDSRSLLDKAFQFAEIQSEVIAIENKLKKSLPFYQDVIKNNTAAIAKLKEIGIDGGAIASLQKQISEATQESKRVSGLISYMSKAI
jgi:hypothetical protein